MSKYGTLKSLKNLAQRWEASVVRDGQQVTATFETPVAKAHAKKFLKRLESLSSYPLDLSREGMIIYQWEE